MRTVIRRLWPIACVAVCLVVCGCLKSAMSGKGGGVLLSGAQASRADYDRTTKGMTRADVDRALAGLGAGQRSSADEALKPGEEPDMLYQRVWNTLTVFRYGSRDDYVYVGFDTTGIARAKAIWLGSKPEKEWEEQTLSEASFSGGKITFDD